MTNGSDSPSQTLVRRFTVIPIGSESLRAHPAAGLINISRANHKGADPEPGFRLVNHGPFENRFVNPEAGGYCIDYIVAMHGRRDRLRVAQQVFDDQTREGANKRRRA